MDLAEFFGHVPFADHLGIEVTRAEGGRAEGRLELREFHSSNPDGMVAHGAVAYALADTVGGAAVVSLNRTVTPTVDMRADYLRPATGEELHATAEVVRNGGSVATTDVAVRDGRGADIAAFRGVYKTSGAGGDTPWVTDRERAEHGTGGEQE